MAQSADSPRGGNAQTGAILHALKRNSTRSLLSLLSKPERGSKKSTINGNRLHHQGGPGYYGLPRFNVDTERLSRFYVLFNHILKGLNLKRSWRNILSQPHHWIFLIIGNNLCDLPDHTKTAAQLPQTSNQPLLRNREKHRRTRLTKDCCYKRNIVTIPRDTTQKLANILRACSRLLTFNTLL